MDPRHIHHCHHHQQQQPPPIPPFDRHGGFPRRIFPPFSSVSSNSSSDGDIRLNKKPFQRKRCAWLVVIFLCVGVGAIAGSYLAYQFLSLSPAMEQLFRGSFRVIEGDTFKKSLTVSSSDLFRDSTFKYKKAIDAIYSESVLRNVFLGSEILAFNGFEGGDLTVQFNINVNTHRIRVDAGDLFITLAEAIRSAKGILSPLNVTIDQDSIEIQERNMEFLYLPSSTERAINSAGGTLLIEDHPSTRINQSVSTAYPTEETTPYAPSCEPMEVDFCLDFKSSAFREQKPLSESLLAQMRLVVASRCHPFAAHFLCTWGVTCDGSLPCLDYCEEFLSNCASVLPTELKANLRCDGPNWHGSGSCLPKPGCVEGLYRSGQGQRVCDGIMDCADFSDEIKCPYCKPGHFHCGSGRNCISPDKKCDGKRDCPNASDEKACLTLAPSAEAAGYVHQYFNEGFIFVHDQGRLGKLCVERNDSAPAFWRPDPQGLLQNIGSSACELLGFRKVAFVRVQSDLELSNGNTLPPYVRIHDPGASSEVTFTAGLCPSKKVLYVGCNHLECGQRPAYLEKKNNLVSHGDFPWHAILLKNEKHVCDATLITSQWLVTTLECFRGSETKAKWTVHFGRVRMGSTSPWQQERRIIGMVKSPLGDNLVLIKMASPVIFSDFARHVCLPEESEGGIRHGLPPWGQRPSKICVRLGWNKQDEVIETRMHEVGPELCPSSPSPWFPNITRPPLCLENTLPGKDCLREVRVLPGAPLLCQSEETKEWVLSGIAPGLVHPKCGIERYRVAAVSGSTEWILKTVEVLSHNTP